MSNQTTMKRITVDSLKNGEYSLGIYDWEWFYKVNNNIAYNNATVYPNPNNGVFYLKINEQFDGTVCVYDVAGRLMHKQLSSSDMDLITVNAADLPEGVYVVIATDMQKNKVYNRKFLVQK